MSDPTANKALVAEFIDALFTEGELEAVDRYLAPGFVNHDPFPGFAPDREGCARPPWSSGRPFPTGTPDSRPTSPRATWGRTDDLGFLQQLGIVPAMPS